MRAINSIRDYDQVEFEISYAKWLMEVFNEPTELELQKMENALYKTFAEKNRIVTLKPLNNIDYFPPQGA
jgi:hypothetical protein